MSKLFQKGQIALIPLLQTGVVITTAMIGGFFFQTRYSDSQLSAFKIQVEKDRIENVQRITRLETNIEQMKDDIKEIKENIKLLLKK